jgi:hypothetical protein
MACSNYTDYFRKDFFVHEFHEWTRIDFCCDNDALNQLFPHVRGIEGEQILIWFLADGFFKLHGLF